MPVSKCCWFGEVILKFFKIYSVKKRFFLDFKKTAEKQLFWENSTENNTCYFIKNMFYKINLFIFVKMIKEVSSWSGLRAWSGSETRLSLLRPYFFEFSCARSPPRINQPICIGRCLELFSTEFSYFS